MKWSEVLESFKQKDERIAELEKEVENLQLRLGSFNDNLECNGNDITSIKKLIKDKQSNLAHQGDYHELVKLCADLVEAEREELLFDALRCNMNLAANQTKQVLPRNCF